LGRRLCTRSVHIHRYGAALPASRLCEKWRPADSLQQSRPSANLAVDSTCKLPMQTSQLVLGWERSFAADAGETSVGLGQAGFFIQVGSLSMPQPKLVNPGFLDISMACPIRTGAWTSPRASKPGPISCMGFGWCRTEERDSRRSPSHPTCDSWPIGTPNALTKHSPDQDP